MKLKRLPEDFGVEEQVGLVAGGGAFAENNGENARDILLFQKNRMSFSCQTTPILLFVVAHGLLTRVRLNER